MTHCDTEEMTYALQLLRDNGDVVALVVLPKHGKKGAKVGYYDNYEKAVADAIRHEQDGTLCVSLNRLKPELLSRSANRLASSQSVSDNDVERLCWLLVDADPIRTAGISSTDAQHEAALAMVTKIAEFLKGLGLPEPVVEDSGNGGHLLYLIDLPNDEGNRQLISRVLEFLDFRFSDSVVQVDRSTGNPSRLIKLPGTVAKKGDDTPSHPHRQSKIVLCPDELFQVEREQLEALAGMMPVLPDGKKRKNSEGSFQIETWLADRGIEAEYGGRWKGVAEKYILSVCPWNDAHTSGEAFVLRFDSGGVAAGCLHDSCRSENWETLRDRLEPDWRNEVTATHEDKDEAQAQTLLRLAEKSASFFTNSLQEAFAEITVGNHVERCKVRSRSFKLWLTKQFYGETNKAPGKDAMNQALGVIEAKALFEGEQMELHLRVAKWSGAFYYDLGDQDWRAVKITQQGWSVVDKPPALFARNRNTRSQVEPENPGDLRTVLRHVPLKDEDDQILYMVYLVSCLVPDIPHPVLALSGEKGAAKSTTTRETRALVDPAVRDLLTMPNGNQDLAITLAGNYMVCFDNLDFISAEKSDILCTAVTGGGISKRTLFTDDEETILSFRRCIVLNGINQVATRADLLDRSLIVELRRIAMDDRKDEAQVRADFERDLSKIVGGMFSALSTAMGLYDRDPLTSLPRMADFARWGYAIAEAIGVGGERFLAAYENNRKKTNQEAIAAHPVASAVISFMQYKGKYESSVADLLGELESTALTEKINTYHKSWPKAAHILTKRLKEVESNLKDLGILFDIRNTGPSKRIHLTNENAVSRRDGGGRNRPSGVSPS